MKDTEQILTDHGIDNPSDAALIRLAAVAAAMPDEPADTLMKRVNFAHARDGVLARALVETIRANTPVPSASQRARHGYVYATACLAAAVIGVSFWGFGLNRALAVEREQRQLQSEQFSRLQASTSKTMADLHAETTAALKTSDASTRANVENFASKLGEYVEKINRLTAENEKLKADLSAGQQKPKLP